MIEDDELGRETFGLLTDRLRDSVLQRQVSIIDENQRLAERKQKRERKEGSAYITLNPMASPGRPQGAQSGIETDLICGEVGRTKGNEHGELDAHLDAILKDCSKYSRFCTHLAPMLY